MALFENLNRFIGNVVCVDCIFQTDDWNFLFILNFFLVRIDVRLVVTFHVYIVHIIVIVNKFTLSTLKERGVSIELKLYG